MALNRPQGGPDRDDPQAGPRPVAKDVSMMCDTRANALNTPMDIYCGDKPHAISHCSASLQPGGGS
jgi:hypothetical protein